jgi:HD-like signal output (HDOD) protein
MVLGFLRRRSVDPEAKLRSVLGDYELPVFRGTVLRILEEIRNEDSSARSIAEVVSLDPGISTRLLKLVNSPAFGSSRTIETVGQAVAILGNSGVESLVLSIGIGAALPGGSAPGFEATKFWSAAARRAATGQALAQLIEPSTRALSFSASLLEDMAVPLLAHSVGTRYGEVLDAWHHGDGNLYLLESSEFGWSHPEVASWLCSAWHLPEALSEAIAAHHPDEGQSDLYCPIAVRLAACLGEEPGQGRDELLSLARSECGLSEDRTIEVLEEAVERAEALSLLFG